MTAPLELAQAWERLLAAIEPLAAETVAAERAVGRCLATLLLAARTQPPPLSPPWTAMRCAPTISPGRGR